MQHIRLSSELANIWTVQTDLTDNGYSIKGYDLDVTAERLIVKKVDDPRIVAEVRRKSSKDQKSLQTVGQQVTVRDGQQVVCKVTLLKKW